MNTLGRIPMRSGGVEALISVDPLDVTARQLSRRALGLVHDWAGTYGAERRDAGKRAKQLEPTGAIEPLE